MLLSDAIDKKMIVMDSVQNALPGHYYTVFQIFYWISFVIFAAISLRGSSRAMEISMQMFGLNMPIPSWYSGRLWLMRLGYYKLTRPKTRAEDWIWIVDHSVQIGSEKCLVILGIRLCDLPIDRALKYEDVEPIELIPVRKSNGDMVYEQLKAATEKTGAPREIIADKGSDIKSGIDRFCDENKETSYIYDIKHALALILKKELESDISWKDFVKLCKDTKQRIQQTELASLAPPNQRSKARYMNVDILINWGNKILTFLNKDEEEISKEFNPNKVKEKLGWIHDYRIKIERWSNIMNMISCTENFTRKRGVYSDAHLDLENELNEFNFGDREINIRNNIVNFVKSESLNAKPMERLLGSSEVIESLFGKQKYIEKQQSKSGFTGLLLSLAAFASKTTKEVIQKAMISIKTKTVIEWQKENIGKSVQAKRAEALDSIIPRSLPWARLLESLKTNSFQVKQLRNAISIFPVSHPMACRGIVHSLNNMEQKLSQDLMGAIG